MRVLVTGGLGFLGVHVVAALEADAAVEEVMILDNLSYTAAPQALTPAMTKVHITHGDVLDHALTADLVRSTDFVVHLAAQTFVDNSIANSRPFLETNVNGTASVLRAIQHAGGERRLVHASTDEVWGQTLAGVFTEESAYRPRNPYSATKAAADHLVRAYGATYGLNYNILHFCNLYGPWQYPEKLIPSTVARLARGGKATIYGSGRQSRSWLHVADAAAAVTKTLHRGRPQESYAIGADAEHTTREIVGFIGRFMGREGDFMEYVPDRPGHDTRYALDSSKARGELGWQPAIRFTDGLFDTVNWLVTHDGWWTRTVHGARRDRPAPD